MQQTLASPKPSIQFQKSINANLTYWQQRTHVLTDQNLPTIDHERQNIYRALQFGLHLTTCWQQVAELMLQMFVLIERRGYWAEWIPLLEQLLIQCNQQDLPLRGRVLDQLGIFYRYNQQLEQALATHQEELQIGQVLEDQWRQAHAHINLGVVNRHLRNFEQAEQSLEAAAKTFAQINAPPIKHAFVAQELGLLAQARHQWDNAEFQYTQAISLWQHLNTPGYLANCLKLLGEVLVAQQQTTKAKKVYDEALTIFRQTNNNLDYARLLNELGILYLKEGELTKACKLLREADSSFLQQAGSLGDQAIVANNLGNVYLAQANLTAAGNAFQRSIHLWESCGDKLQLANALAGFAEVQAAQGEAVQARQSYQHALNLLRNYPNDIWAQQLQKRFIEEQNALPTS